MSFRSTGEAICSPVPTKSKVKTKPTYLVLVVNLKSILSIHNSAIGIALPVQWS